MKISSISDIHYPKNERGLEETVDSLRDSEVLIIAGDISDDIYEYNNVLKKFSDYQGLKINVLGNHDIYVESNGNSEDKIEWLKRISQANNFNLLDSKPVIYNGVGFVGGMGWYDYEFAQKTKDVPIVILDGPSYFRKKLDELTEEDYAQKKIFDGHLISSWNDVNYVKWDYSDKEFLDQEVERLRKDLAIVTPEVDKIVYVSHHVPIKEFVQEREGDAKWSYFNAFQGSPKLGEVALRNPKLSLMICGHTHLDQKPVRKKNVDCYDISQELDNMRVTQLEL